MLPKLQQHLSNLALSECYPTLALSLTTKKALNLLTCRILSLDSKISQNLNSSQYKLYRHCMIVSFAPPLPWKYYWFNSMPSPFTSNLHQFSQNLLLISMSFTPPHPKLITSTDSILPLHITIPPPVLKSLTKSSNISMTPPSLNLLLIHHQLYTTAPNCGNGLMLPLHWFAHLFLHRHSQNLLLITNAPPPQC